MNGRIDITLDAQAPPEPHVPLPLTNPVAPTRIALGAQALRSAALVFGAVLIVRAAFVEPYGVPTGSMAPTLIGIHRSCNCTTCGMRVAVGDAEGSRHYQAVRCPNCDAALGLGDAHDEPGDRLLVDKQAYDWRGPRRSETIVFRAPNGGDKPFVKRVVGLPGERVRIRDGDVLIHGEPARKTLAFCRTLQLPVYDAAHAPPVGWSGRWQADPADAVSQLPWVDSGELVFPVETTKSFRWLSYSAGVPLCDGCAYNATEAGQGSTVHDFYVRCDISVQRGAGEIAVSLTDGADVVTALLPVGGARSTRLSAGTVSRETRNVQLKPGKRVRIELAFVDRRAFLAIDGDEVFAPIDLPAVPERAAVVRPVQVGAWGVAATVSRLWIGRDIHYVSAGPNGVVDECQIPANEYFVLGDNSARSEDSRLWPVPGVPAAALVGKPLFMHQPGRGPTGFEWSRVGFVR